MKKLESLYPPSPFVRISKTRPSFIKRRGIPTKLALPKLIKDFWYLWKIKYIWKFFRLFWKNGQICTEAVVPQRQTHEFLYKQNINFWRETHDLLLFKLWKQLKIYPSFARTDLHNLKMSFAKINQHENVSAQVKTHTSASFTWLI